MDETKTKHMLDESNFSDGVNFKTIVKATISQPTYLFNDDGKPLRSEDGKKLRAWKEVDGKKVYLNDFQETITYTLNWSGCIAKDLFDLATAQAKVLLAKTRKEGQVAVMALDGTEIDVKGALLTKTRAAAVNTDPSKMTDAELDIWQAGILAEMERRTAAKKE